MNVKTTFLHGDLEEKLNMEQQQGYAVQGKKFMVSKLKGSLDDLKHTPRKWYKVFDMFILDSEYPRS